MRLLPCPDCNHHVRASEGACPHCGHRLPSVHRVPPTAAALLLGLLPIACTSTERPPAAKAQETQETKAKPVPQPDPPVDAMPAAPAYGAPPSDSDGPDAEPVPPPEPVAEPEYGVPITETPAGKP